MVAVAVAGERGALALVLLAQGETVTERRTKMTGEGSVIGMILEIKTVSVSVMKGGRVMKKEKKGGGGAAEAQRDAGGAGAGAASEGTRRRPMKLATKEMVLILTSRLRMTRRLHLPA